MLESDLNSTGNTDYNADQKNQKNGNACSDKIVIKDCPDGEFKQVELQLQEDVNCLNASGNIETVIATFKDENGQASENNELPDVLSGNIEKVIATSTVNGENGQASENNELPDVLHIEDVIELEITETRVENQLHAETQIFEASSKIVAIASDFPYRSESSEHSGYGASEILQVIESHKQCDMPIVEVTHTSLFESPTSTETSVENVPSEGPLELTKSSHHSNVDRLSGKSGELHSPRHATTSVENRPDICDDAIHQFSSVTNDEISTAIKNVTVSQITENISLGKNHLQEECELHDSSFNQDWSNHEACMAAIVSADLEGWQRFDVEENAAAIPCVDDGSLRQQQELWEQLLEDGLESTEKNVNTVTFPAAPIQFDESHSWLASPGNPFIESSNRISNFSEAEGFAVPGSGLTYGHQESSMYFEEDPFWDANDNKDLMATVDPRSNKSVPAVNMKAPSIGANFVDSGSPALLTSMPLYQRAGYDPGHETWEANFDTPVLFSAQNNLDPNETKEIGRSLSMPRIADQRHVVQEAHQQEQEHRWSFSAASREISASATPNKKKHLPQLATELKSAVVVSPRISPLVKKVVKKIQASPVVTKSTLKNASQSSNNVATVAEKPKKKKKSMWASFICCFKSN